MLKILLPINKKQFQPFWRTKNKTFEITADLMAGITEKGSYKAIEYLKDSSSSKVSYVTLDSEPTMIYNGEYAALDYDLMDIANASGKLVLLE